MERLTPKEAVAFDAEYQNLERPGERPSHRLGWAAAVNTKGETILECHVYYPEEEGVRVWTPPAMFGVARDDLKMKNGAIPAALAEKWFAEIFAGRKVVVHGGSGDRTAFKLVDAFSFAEEIVDTQDLYQSIKLGVLHAREFPSAAAVQVGRHTAVEDAGATMDLFLKKQPYDRAAEKEMLRAKRMSTTCKASDEQLREVEDVRRRHRQAVRNAEIHAQGQGAQGNGGRGGGFDRGSGRGRGRGRGKP